MQTQVHLQSASRYRLPTRLILYLAMAAGAVCAPLLLLKLQIPVIRFGAPHDSFVFFAALTWLTIGYIELKDRRASPLTESLPIVVPILLGLHYLAIFAQYSTKSTDYLAYEYGARAVLQGNSPYYYNTILPYVYIYWPLLAQSLAAVYTAIDSAATTALGPGTFESASIWYIIYYLYECSQYLLLIAAYFLCVRMSTRLGFEKVAAALLAAALFLLSDPLYGTLRWNQLGLFLLNCFLVSILFVKSHPILSGFAVALGGHIKLYPYILLLPWTLKRQWKAVAVAVSGSAIILLLQTRAGQDWEMWRGYTATQWVSTSSSYGYSNNSLRNLFSHLVRQVGSLFPLDAGLGDNITAGAIASVSVVAIMWYLWRFVARERAYKDAGVSAVSSSGTTAYDAAMVGHSVDVIALALILSPSAWSHHYLISIPLAIWTVAVRGRQNPLLVGVALLLVLGLPTFNVFPFSFHRILGLFLIWAITPPSTLPPSFRHV